MVVCPGRQRSAGRCLVPDRRRGSAFAPLWGAAFSTKYGKRTSTFAGQQGALTWLARTRYSLALYMNRQPHVAVVGATVVVSLFNLTAQAGISVVGPLPQGLPVQNLVEGLTQCYRKIGLNVAGWRAEYAAARPAVPGQSTGGSCLRPAAHPKRTRSGSGVPGAAIARQARRHG